MAHILDLTLVDGADSAPVAGAKVSVSDSSDLDLSLVSDARGVAVIELSEVPDHLAIRVRKEGFVRRLVVWDLKQLGITLPERYTLTMERGTTMSGFVRNQNGEPVEGANVLINLRYASNDGGQPRIYNDITELPARTDGEGRWRFDEAPANLEPLHVRLEHPEYISNEHIPALPAKEEFRNGTAVLTAIKGVPCEGTVTDAQGRPLEGVKVICGEDGADSSSTPTRSTDARGYFRFGSIALTHHGKPAVLSFQKSGYAPVMLELEPTSAPILKNVTLRPGKSLRVRFIDSEGEPIPGAALAMNAWKGYRPFHRRFIADGTGVAHWPDAPEDAVEYSILHIGYQIVDTSLTASDDVQTVVLRRSTKVTGRVVDAQTQQPIPAFSLVVGRFFPERGSHSSLWNYAWVYPHTGGKYQCSLGRPARIRGAHGHPGQEGFHRLRIEAPGYQPGISRPIANEEGVVECHFELQPGAPVEGLIRDMEGNPVSGAQLAVSEAGNTVIVSDGTVSKRGYIVVTANEQGRYVFPPQEEDFTIVIAHPHAGYLVTSCSALRAAPDVQLLAWGRFELATTAPREAQANYYIRPVVRREEVDRYVHVHNSPVLASDGSWIFDCLMAGATQLYSSGQPLRSIEQITIENGKTTRLDLRTGRRAVVGRIVLPEGISTEEPLAKLRLSQLLPGSQEPLGLSSYERRIEGGGAWRKAPEGISPRAPNGELRGTLDFQGRFRIDDLVPGRYKLHATFYRSLPPGHHAGTDIAGTVTKEFELPAGEEPFDLGALMLTLRDGGRSR